MTRLILSLTLFLIGFLAFSQTTYEKTMTEKIAKIATCKTAEDFTTLANDFSGIGEKEKTKWLPYYYATLATIQKGRTQMHAGKMDDLDAIASEAEKFLAKSEDLNPDNAENYILEKMIHTLKLMVNPPQRFMTEAALSAEALSKAEKLDAENPRISLMKAEDVYYTPEQFGGSKTKALEIFQKSIEQFKIYKPKTTLDPNWGQSEAEYFLQNKP